MRNHVGGGQLHVVDPPGTAGSHERFLFPVPEAVHKFGRFLHNRNVRAEIGGKGQAARVELTYRRGEFPRHVRARQHAELFADNVLGRRRELPDNVAVAGIVEGGVDGGQGVLDRDGPGRAVPRALSATDTGALRERVPVLQRGDGLSAPDSERQDIEALPPGTHLHAFPAADTLRQVARDGKAGRIDAGGAFRRPRRLVGEGILPEHRDRRRAQ